VANAAVAGEVHLLGHSFGGYVALETARLLEARGVEIGMVTLVDTQSVGDADAAQMSRAEILLKLSRLLAMRHGRSLSLSRLELEGLEPARQDRLMAEAVLGPSARGSVPSAFLAMLTLFEANVRTRYRPNAPLDRPVDLLLAAEGLVGDALQVGCETARRDWRATLPNVTVTAMPGNHVTMLQPPFVDRVAQWWRASQARSAGRERLAGRAGAREQA